MELPSVRPVAIFWFKVGMIPTLFARSGVGVVLFLAAVIS